ncbi:MAG: hypothetical protein ACK4K9_02075 [Bacteroidia bacterium]
MESVDQPILLDDITKAKWYRIVFELKKQFGKKPDLNGLLFIIGVNEIGKKGPFNKQEKTELMHIATCKLLSYDGYYALTHHDADGWPHYTLKQKPPFVELTSQENLLKKLVVRYFIENGIID